ncbi:MAG: hypothetical protein M3680_33280 [Myxococcota bacterium]|nr:hypothetical protein [Myxococcota bacterium]
MRILCALVFVVAACGGTSKKPEGAIVNEGPIATPDTCCCKSIPLTSADNSPVYEVGNRMECSSKQGECVDEVQCTMAAEAPAVTE